MTLVPRASSLRFLPIVGASCLQNYYFHPRHFPRKIMTSRTGLQRKSVPYPATLTASLANPTLVAAEYNCLLYRREAMNFA
uniref:Uncharacterized protein n=1 Tax=Arundo donax TaxID=35708 RepID=A0A0A9AUK3_ARUDO